MATIKVLINGATGKMGQETVRAISDEEDITLVGATCSADRGNILKMPSGEEIPLSTNLKDLIEHTSPDVIVDFTNATTCMEAVKTASAYSVDMVLGASGLTNEDISSIRTLTNQKSFGAIIAPNFALGAVILKKLAEQAAPYFEYLDIVESHHEAKIDAPSGFAMNLANARGSKKDFTRTIT